MGDRLGGRAWPTKPAGREAAAAFLDEALLRHDAAAATALDKRRLLAWLTSDLTGLAVEPPDAAQRAALSPGQLRAALSGLLDAQMAAALTAAGQQQQAAAASAAGAGGGARDGGGEGADRPNAGGLARAAAAAMERPASGAGPGELSDPDLFPALSTAGPPSRGRPDKGSQRRLIPTRVAPQPLPHGDSALLPAEPLRSAFGAAPPEEPPPGWLIRPLGGSAAVQQQQQEEGDADRNARQPGAEDDAPRSAAEPAAVLPAVGDPPGRRVVSASQGRAAPADRGAVNEATEGGTAAQARDKEAEDGALWGEAAPLFWLAAGHAALLRAGAVPSLSAQLGQLLQLLTASLEAPKPAAAAKQGSAASPCGLDLAGSGLAHRYCIAVLQGSGRLIQAAPARLMAVLIDRGSRVGEQLAARAPELLAAMEEGIAAERQRRLRSDKAYNSVAAEAPSRGTPSLVGLTWTLGQELNQGPRSQQDQQRVSNMERCRDDFVKLMQDASRGSFTAPNKSQQGGVKQIPEGLQDSGGRKGAPPVNEEMVSVLKQMRYKAAELLQGLHPGNLPGFAAIFLGGFLQAARTGEAVMDDQLASLEQKDPSRFQRLSQRFHAKPGSAGGGGRGVGRTGGGRGGGRGGRSGGAAAGPVGADEQAAVSLAVAEEFPASLQLYVVFLEACDSARLNAAIASATSARLAELSQLGLPGDRGAGGALAGGQEALGDRVAQLTSLALLLSYFSFATAASANAGSVADAGAAASAASAGLQTVGPVHLDTVLRSAETTDGAGLAATLPWLLAYLRFVPRHGGAAASVRRSCLLPWLAGLYRRPELRPESAAFGAAALCLRSLLDDWAAQSGGFLIGSGGLLEIEHAASGAPELERWSALPQMLLEMAAAMDARYAAYCCPALEEAVHRAMASFAGGQGADALRQRRSHIRRLTPSQPKAQPSSAVPPALQAAAFPVHDAVKLRLQKAFLDEYSGLGQKVLLRDLVAYVSDVAAANAVTLVTQAGLNLPSLDSWLETVLWGVAEQLRAPGGGLNGIEGLDEAVLRQRLLGSPALAEQLERKIGDTTYATLAAAFEQATPEIGVAIKAALRALVPPLMEDAVLRTAIAIAVEYAASTCAQQLLELVPRKVQQHAAQACQRTATKVVKSVRSGQPSPSQAASSNADTVGIDVTLSPAVARAAPSHEAQSDSSTSTPRLQSRAGLGHLAVTDPSVRASAARADRKDMDSDGSPSRLIPQPSTAWRITAVAVHRGPDDRISRACLYPLDGEKPPQASCASPVPGLERMLATPLGSAFRPPAPQGSIGPRRSAGQGAPAVRVSTPGQTDSCGAAADVTPASSVAAMANRMERLSTMGGSTQDDTPAQCHPAPLKLASLLEEAATSMQGSEAAPSLLDERKARALESRIDPQSQRDSSLARLD